MCMFFLISAGVLLRVEGVGESIPDKLGARKFAVEQTEDSVDSATLNLGQQRGEFVDCCPRLFEELQ